MTALPRPRDASARVAQAPAAPSRWGRVLLRPALSTDEAGVAPWLAEVLDDAGGAPRLADEPATLESLQARLLAGSSLWMVATLDQVPIGVLVTLHGRDSVWCIDVLSIRREQRNRGFGLEAICALEGMLGAGTLLAGVPRGNGLAIYFWLRAGFRPLYPAPGREPLGAHRFWMQREIQAPG